MTIRKRVDEAALAAEVEAALRWLAKRKGSGLRETLREAINEPASEPAAVLRSLVAPTVSLTAGSVDARAFAVWGLIVDEVGSTGDARHRHTLMAAFRIPPAPGAIRWKATLGARFEQLIPLPGVFGDPPPTTAAPMHKAWRHAPKALAVRLAEKLVSLDGPGWQRYVDIGRAAVEVSDDRAAWRARAASERAQPVFVERMLITAVMHRRNVRRRITERDIVACEDGVDGYDVYAAIGWTHDLADLPVAALWACRVGAVPPAHPGGSVRLGFGRTLEKGERHSFVSEALDGQLDEEREWLDIDVDHHGIAPGGLTIRLNFDPECLPEVCWWYAEQLEFERRCRPPDGDPHLLPVRGGFVRHTFVDGCHPRENYGIAFRW